MRYKPKKIHDQPKKAAESRLTARGKMTFLVLWGIFCTVLYFTLSKFYAMTPVIVIELLLLAGLLYLLVTLICAKLERAKFPDGSERLIKLEDRIRLLKIFILPPTVIVLVDFFISLYSFSSLGM